MDRQAAWEEIERLSAQLKLQEASARLEELLPAVRAAGDPVELARALIRGAQIRAGRGQPEEAVRFLQAQPWPEDRLWRAAVSVYYAETLEHYAAVYRWTLWKREAVASNAPVDVDRWTTGQIFEAASRAYLDAWHERELLGQLPVTELGELLEVNTYPREVRGTLRDSVTYLWAELLADSTYWSPTQSNAVERLDLPALDRGTEVPAERLGDPEVHPLARLAAVLTDLERWHLSRGNRDGALEARLERLRRLRSHAGDSGSRETEALRKTLEAELAAYREVPWWATGMAELAELHRAGGDLVRARDAARAGHAAFPDSPGGRRCLAIAGEIEAPAWSLMGMSSDGLGRRSLRVSHRNVPTLWFRAYVVDLEGRLERTHEPVFPRWGRDFQPAGPPAFAWKTDLPATPDFQTHDTDITPPIDRPGAWLVAASRAPDFSGGGILSVPLVLGDLVLLARQKEPGGSLEVSALSGSRGEPRPGVQVHLQEDGGEGERPAPGVTGAGGTAAFSARSRFGYRVLARQGEDLALLEHLPVYPEETRDEPGMGSLLFTDRSIYRPRQRVLWKVLVYRDRGEGRLRGEAGTSVTVSLVDPNGQQVESRTVSTNGFGTASGEFAIPPGRPLGSWRLESSRQGQAFLQVEEYKRPTFEVSLKDPVEPLRLGRPAVFPGEARYYFGLPVTRGQVRWRVTRETRFGGAWWVSGRGGETVAAGTARLSSDGSFEISFTPEAGQAEQAEPAEKTERRGQGPPTYTYRVEADLTDEGGETRGAERSFRLGRVSVEAEITPGRRLQLAGQPGTVTIQRRDLAGIGRAGEGSWSLAVLRQPETTVAPADLPLPPSPEEEGAFRTDGDRRRPRFSPEYDPAEALRLWADGERVAAGTVSHGADGVGELTLPALPAGAYRLRYATADDSGERFSISRDLLVAGETTPLALPAVLEVDSTGVRPGGRLRVLAHSGFPGQLLRLETWRSGELIARRDLRMGRDSSLVEIPIRPRDRGGFTLKLVAVHDHQLVELTQEVFVPWDDRRLEIGTATFRDRVRPGGRETWTVKVRPAEGEELDAGGVELLAYMYDRSLDLFAPHEPPAPLALYPDRRGAGEVHASLGTAYGGSDSSWFPPPPPLQPDRIQVRRRVSEWQTDAGLEMTVAAAAPELDERRISMGATVSAKDAGGPPLAPSPPPPPAPPPRESLRGNFSETAFWRPHLLVGRDGSAAIEVEVPDSVTAWSFQVHAVTPGLRAGSLEREVRSVKELMVRPYLPRFLREGDRAELKVLVDNASGRELRGEVVFDILDPGSEASLLADFGLDPLRARAPFVARPGEGATVSFPLTAPRRVGPVAFKVTAAAGGESDGELRLLPVLPSRVHLAQSRFAALASEDQRRELRFEDLARDDDPTRIDEQMVVTLDAQLFYGALAALPYLVDYPYECTEQTLNRFLSTGILASLFDGHPALAAMAEEMARRDTATPAWDAADPNRRMALEETPWLAAARGGGGEDGGELLRVLDPRIARARRDEALAELARAQLPNGAFPWWPGGPASPYLTIYLLHGFARAAEAGIEIPRPLVEGGWSYLADWFRTEEAPRLAGRTCCPELLVFLNYVASVHPDPSWMGSAALTAEERGRILDASFAGWQGLSGYLRTLLALTLHRMGRPDDARLVLGAVLDLAQTTPEEGTFWAPEEHAWLWYQDRIETHAFILLALMEIAPQDPRRHGLVQWLFLNRQLNHWHSTRATAEVLYALAHYLEREGQLGQREEATVRVAGRSTTFTFEPGRYTGGGNRLVIPGDRLGPDAAVVTVEKASPGLMFASATWHFSTERLPAAAQGDLFGVTRRYFLRSTEGSEAVLRPLAEGAVLSPGDEVEVHLSITSRAPAEYVHLRDPRPAGFEPDATSSRSGYRWGPLAPARYEETRDSGTSFFFDWLPAGEHTLIYRVRANLAGTFRAGPAVLQSMYAPEFTAYSAGDLVTVAPPELSARATSGERE